MLNFQNAGEAEILPGCGLSVIRFGMAPAEVDEKLGKPLESTTEEAEGHSYLLLEYPEGLYLFFDSEYGLRLSSLEVDQRFPCTLFGEPLFPNHRERLLELLDRHLSRSQISAIQESEDEALESRSLWIPSLGMTFYFGLPGTLTECQWGPLFDSNDEIIWPERRENLLSADSRDLQQPRAGSG